MSRAGGKKKASEAIISLSEDELKGDGRAGALPIDEDELNAAFDFFDVDGKGKLTPNDLRARLGAFYKNLPVRPSAARAPWRHISPGPHARAPSAARAVAPYQPAPATGAIGTLALLGDGATLARARTRR